MARVETNGATPTGDDSGEGVPALHNVLVVDDSATMRAMVKEELGQGPYSVIDASDGTRAIEILTTVSDIRAVLLDVRMPGLSGFEVLERLRTEEMRAKLKAVNNLNVPVIFVTALDTYEERMKGFELGAVEFVNKRSVRRRLRTLVGQVVAPVDDSALRALVVDDSPTMRAILCACLRELGVNTHEVEDGTTALAYLKASPGTIDLVLTDLHMRYMGGSALCRQIRQDLGLEELPIIVLSAEADTEHMLELFELGATDYLTKPFIKEEFMARLAVHLQRLRLNSSLKASVEELTALNTMKDKLIAVCSHDFRSPLNGILGFSDLLLETEGLSADNAEMLTQIKTAGGYLLSLVNDILDLGRAQAGEKLVLVPESCAHLLASSVASFRGGAATKGVNLHIDNTAHCHTVAAHQTSLIRVFNNLISNALKFTPAGGRIVVSMFNGADDLRVRVQDTGLGIPAALMPELFKEYSSASRQGTAGEASTGLGLSITKHLVEAHGGQIEVVSREGRGTAFTVIFPSCRPASHLVGATVVPAPPLPAEDLQSSLKVLLAEDNSVNIKLAQRLLERQGCEVVVAKNGQQAIERFEEALSQKPFDLILMDLQMPEVDGFQAASEIRRLQSASDDPVNIVAMTAHTASDVQEQCDGVGINSILTKPINRDLLRELLSTAP